MNSALQFLRSPTGQLATIGLLAIVAVGTMAWQRSQRTMDMPAAKAASTPGSLPQVFQRKTTKLDLPPTPVATSTKSSTPVAPPAPAILGLALFASKTESPNPAKPRPIPLGLLIPCDTVFALESNHLDTPIIGLVSADVWHHGKLLIPANTEVHGRAVLDRTRERLAAEHRWSLITPNGEATPIDAVIMERTVNPPGDTDGATGLSGTVLRPHQGREAKLFAATFLAAATAALRDNHTTTGVFGDTVTPEASLHNATLAGTSAVLRDYAQQIAKALEEDGIYLSVAAGTPFYLYVTQPNDPAGSFAATPPAL